jgi:hypothetical protein
LNISIYHRLCPDTRFRGISEWEFQPHNTVNPNPDKPELKIDPPEAELMSLRSVLFKSENILSHFFCIESKKNSF